VALWENHSKPIDGWNVSWESHGPYRLWCKQEHPANEKTAAVVMLNPGSLSGNGSNLSRDTTLRVLRELFGNSGYNPFVVNLFNLATPKPEVLFDQWPLRDDAEFDYSSLPVRDFSAVLYAYGSYEHHATYSDEVLTRIDQIKSLLSGIPEIVVPKASNGTPKHPMRIQIEKLKDVFRDAISKHAAANNSFKPTPLRGAA